MPERHKSAGSDFYPHLLPYNPNPKTVSWERLESKRLEKLGLGIKRYSRHFQRFQKEPEKPHIVEKKDHNGVVTKYIMVNGELMKMNSIAPFYTAEKPTCGFFFSRITDNKKQKIGIPPSDLVKWRSFVH